MTHSAVLSILEELLVSTRHRVRVLNNLPTTAANEMRKTEGPNLAACSTFLSVVLVGWLLTKRAAIASVLGKKWSQCKDEIVDGGQYR